MSLRYKIGDRVKTLEKIPYSVGADEVANQIYTIEEVDAKDERLTYKINHRCWAYWINDDCIDHEATARLNNKLKYKVGDRVVLGDAKTLTDINIDEEYAHEIAIIDIISDDAYWCRVEKDGEKWNIGDEEIDHEATAKLNNKSNDDPIGGVMSIDMSSYITRRIDCEGGETMNANEILEKWKNKRICEVETEYKNKEDQLTKEDEIVKLVEKHVAQINKIIKEKYDGVANTVNVAVIRTPETDEKINLAEEEMSNKKLNIKKKIEEIKAVLEVAENQDKVFEILNKQGIIDKNYNIL